MLALFMRNEKSGPTWEVWPGQEVIAPGTVQETASYFFELRGSSVAREADLIIDDQALEALRSPDPEMARWRWSPGFHAGTIEVELRIPGNEPRRFEIVTDPDRRKLTRENFDTMLGEILDDTFALFSLSSFRKGVARGVGKKPPAIARLEFIRSRVEELEQTVEQIERRPRRRLTGAEAVVPYHRAASATGPEILRSFRSGRVLAETTIPSRLPEALKGFLPERIRIRKRVSSLDLPEHRQMAACLRVWSTWLGRAAELLEYAAADNDPESVRTGAVWAQRCRRLSARLNVLTKAQPFAEASSALPFLTLTSVFRNDPAYRRFYRIWHDMNAGIAAVFGDFLNLPLARTFQLYEMWCFLRLVRAAAQEFGTDSLDVRDLFISDSAGGVTVAAGAVTVPVGEGWKLCFQKQYREFWIEADRKGSYSRPMMPDIVAMRESDAGEVPDKLIVLDAKYRIDAGLHDALSSIHMYRDALVQEVLSGSTTAIVSAAYLLTPYVASVQESYPDTPMPARLFHPQYRAGFNFGAVTLRPGMTINAIAEALRSVVADATSDI